MLRHGRAAERNFSHNYAPGGKDFPVGPRPLDVREWAQVAEFGMWPTYTSTPLNTMYMPRMAIILIDWVEFRIL